MPRLPLRTLVGPPLLTAALLISGCVAATKYKLAKPGGAPAEELGWKGISPDFNATLRHVIVFRGPGSWKREARWDEYVLRLENRSSHPMVVREVGLHDFEGTIHLPGSDPWALEKQSYTEWERFKRRGIVVVAGAGVVLGYTAVLGGAIAGSSTAAVAVGALPIIGIVDVTAVAVINHNNKQAVLAEFSRRRLPLPLTLAPGEVREGSCFFIMTPGPRSIHFLFGDSAASEGVSLPLPRLAKLHFPAEDTPAKR